MKHHFADLLDREGGYWTIVPNRDRYSYKIGDIPIGNKEITIVTIGRDDKNWERIFTLPNLEELTLHESSTEQLQSISQLLSLKRLRITHARPKNIEFLRPLKNIEELVLEYVSGFSDLSPLRELCKLRALHIENLRRVSKFGGLVGLKNLKYLRIDGTLDWKQPIEDFEFLKGLPELEVLSFGRITSKFSYPALLPALSLKKLKKIKIPRNMLPANEYALLEVGLKNVEGARWDVCTRFAYSNIPLPANDVRAYLPDHIIKSDHPEVLIRYDGKRMINDPDSEWFEFLGKSAGRVKCSNPKSEEKCAEHQKKYDSMKEEAKRVINNI